MQHIVHTPSDRPDAEVLVNVEWCRGEVRMQTQDQTGAWLMIVAYRPDGEVSSYLGNFPADKVRPDSVDRSRGRA